MAMSSIGIARGPGANRRGSPRRGMLPPIVMADFAFQEGVLLRDLSEAGLGAHALVSPAVGVSTNCTFELPDHGRIEAHGVVTWSDNSGRFGLRFDHVPEAARPRLKEWLVRQAEPVSDYGSQTDGAALAGPADDLNLLRQQLETGQVSSDAAFHLLTESIRAITGATGAAIAIEDEGAFVCRASSGAAPDLGAHLDPSSGLSGECIRTADIVRCADTETDPRVDRLVCRKLELRSVVIVPVLRAGKVAGVIEVFSSAPHAFQNNAVRLLRKASQVLAVVSPAPQRVTAVESVPQPAAPEPGDVVTGNGKPKSALAPESPAPPPVVMKPAVATKHPQELPEAAVEPPPFVPLLSPLPQPEEKPGADAKADQVLAELRAKKLAELAAQQKAADRAAQKRAAKAVPPAATTPVEEAVAEEAQADTAARRQLLLRVVLVALLLIACTMAVWRFWPKSTARPQPAPPAPSAPVSTGSAPVQPNAGAANVPAPVAPPAAASPQSAPPQPAPRKTTPATNPRPAEPFEEVQIKSVAAPAPPPAQPQAVTPPPIPVMANSQGNGVSSLLATSVRAPVLAESAPTSTGVTGGRLKSRVEPVYPATARALALAGTVVLNATVDTSGRVVRVTRVSGNPILGEAAAAAVRRWVYEPFVLNGKPVQTNATITVKFAAP